MFRDPDIIRRLRGIHSNGTVRLCGWCPQSHQMAKLLAEQLASESIAFLRQVNEHDPISIPRMAIDAGDLVQATMIKVLEHSEEFSGQTLKEWKRWVRTVRNNTICDALKAAGRRKRAHGTSRPGGLPNVPPDGDRFVTIACVADLAHSPEESAELRELCQHILDAADRNRQGDGELLDKQFRLGYSIEELAQGNDVPSSTMRKRLQRATDRLRHVLLESPPPPPHTPTTRPWADPPIIADAMTSLGSFCGIIVHRIAALDGPTLIDTYVSRMEAASHDPFWASKMTMATHKINYAREKSTGLPSEINDS